VSQTDADHILSTLKQEIALCDELAALRSQQRTLIDVGDAEKLLDVLAGKQRVITRIGELEKQLKPVKADWEHVRQGFPPSRRLAIGEAFRNVQNLLEGLIAKETEDAEALVARKQDLAQELETFDRKRQLGAAYQPVGGRPESRFVDRKDA